MNSEELQQQLLKAQRDLKEVEQTKNEISGTCTLLRQKFDAVREELIDVCANVATIEAEAEYKKKKYIEQSEKERKRLESQLTFLQQELRTSNQSKHRALKDLEVIKQQNQLEKNRLAAQQRLQSSKLRQLEQQHFSQKSQHVAQSTATQTSHSIGSVRDDNLKLLSFLTGKNMVEDFSRLLQIPANICTTFPLWEILTLNGRPSSSNNGMNYSPLVYSQSNLLSKGPKTPSILSELAYHLQEALHKMLLGEECCLVFVPVLIEYLSCPVELDPSLLVSILRILHCMLSHNVIFQSYVSDNAIPREDRSRRVALPLLIPEQPDASYHELAKSFLIFRNQLLGSICRKLKNHLSSPLVIQIGLNILLAWYRFNSADFVSLLQDRVIEDILLSPKTNPANKTTCVLLLNECIASLDLFSVVCQVNKSNYLFNRIAKMLVTEQSLALKYQIVQFFADLVATYPIQGIQLVVDRTRGQPKEVDSEKSIVYYLVVLLDGILFPYRSNDITTRQCPIQLIQQSFILLHLLSHYINVTVEVVNLQYQQNLKGILQWIVLGELDSCHTNQLYSKIADAWLSRLD